MRKSLYAAAGAAAATFVWDSAANATVVTDFTFSGQTNVEGNVTNLGPAFPAGGVFRTDNGNEGSSSFGTVTGSGSDMPVFTFSNGATAIGDTTANSTTTIKVDITNDLAVAQTITWNFLIFAGGAGIIEPNLYSSGCNKFQVDICDSFFSPPASHGASAALNFGVNLTDSSGTASIFGGDIFIDATTNTTNFNNIALTNFRLAPTNSQYYWWDDTTFSQNLGVFLPGETKSLEFFTTAMVASSANDGCVFNGEFLQCVGASAGYGDPDSQGGIITRSFSFISAPFEETFDMAPVEEIPIPGAIWLFLTGIGGLFGARKLKKSA